ncbi:MAG: ung [Chlamydiales bacterium]|jgi:uracil-DNA glycosylase|nr:ung [Chlamydiales bacterium]
MDSFYPFELGSEWESALQEELKKPYIAQLASFVAAERRGADPVYPPEHLMFNALKKTPLSQVKVVIVGQDPYHGPGQAHGLSFSVPQGVATPPSLQNIFKELNADLHIPISSNGCLIPWAEQGVLLLNATLTVKKSTPLSHHGKGWEIFTDAILNVVAQRAQPTVFILWGKNAQQKALKVPSIAPPSPHLILTAAHPSPFSAHSGFFGCRHFSKTNAFLEENRLLPINWDLSSANPAAA